MLKLILLVLPLGLDTFAVSAALGMRVSGRRERLRTSLVLAGFEAAMPVVGLLLGRGLGNAIGGAADAVAIAVLAGLGLWMLVADSEDEAVHVGELSRLLQLEPSPSGRGQGEGEDRATDAQGVRPHPTLSRRERE